MKTFKDLNGKEYAIRLTISTVKKLRDSIGFDMLNLTSQDSSKPRAVLELYDDDVLAAQVVYHILSEESLDGMSEEQFIERLDGECAADMKEALLEEIRLFFLKSRRKEMADAMKKYTEVMKEFQKKKLESLMKMDAKAIAGVMFTSLQESSESTQTP